MEKDLNDPCEGKITVSNTFLTSKWEILIEPSCLRSQKKPVRLLLTKINRCPDQPMTRDTKVGETKLDSNT